MTKSLMPLEHVTNTQVNAVGTEYLRALWLRRDAAMTAPFTVGEDALLREEPEQRTKQAGSSIAPAR